MRNKSIKKNIQNPLASSIIGLNPRRMKDLESEIATEEAPEWAVRGGADVVLVAGDDLAHGWSRWTVGEESTVLEEGFVSNRAVGDKDGGAVGDAEGDDGAIFGGETAEERFNLERRLAEPQESCDDGY